MIRLAGIEKESVVESPGYSYTIFTQGCHFHCKGCHSPHTWDTSKGTLVSAESIIEDLKNYPFTDNFVLCGGEAFLQANELTGLCRMVKQQFGYKVNAYTGFTIDEILNGSVRFGINLLFSIDYLVDGKFEFDKRDITLMYRGSTNQRIIDVQRTLKEGKVFVVDFDSYGNVFDVRTEEIKEMVKTA